MGEIKKAQKRELLSDRKRRLLDIEPERQQPRRRRWISVAVLIAAAALGGLGAQTVYDGGLAGAFQWANVSTVVLSVADPFGLCHEDAQADCVIDGYTIEYKGDRVRMVDYDAPEIGSPRCPYELELGRQAKRRLLELLNSGPVEVRPRGDPDVDQDGRKLRLVTVSGQSVGNFLMGEGLAAPWEGAGHRHDWCS